MAPLAGKQVLDVGCGGGILADAMARKGAEVTMVVRKEEIGKIAQHLVSKMEGGPYELPKTTIEVLQKLETHFKAIGSKVGH